jgi:hypothetical protein
MNSIHFGNEFEQRNELLNGHTLCFRHLHASGINTMLKIKQISQRPKSNTKLKVLGKLIFSAGNAEISRTGFSQG